jgi:hypothetical protein
MAEGPVPLSYTELRPAQAVSVGRRAGELLVMEGDTVLGPLCIRCGGQRNLRREQFLIPAPLPLQLETTAPVYRLHAHVCLRHAWRRWVLNALAAVLAILGVMTCSCGMLIVPRAEVGMGFLFALLLLTAIACRVAANRWPRVQCSTDTLVFVRGVHPALLAGLPEHEEAPPAGDSAGL